MNRLLNLLNNTGHKMSAVAEQDLQHIWDKAARYLPELNSARLFITGGTGFFGRWLLESLCFAKQQLGLKTQVVILSRDPAAFWEKAPQFANVPGLQWISGDVRNFEFPAGTFTHVIHAATQASAKLNQENPLLMLETITKGTERALEFAAQAGVKKFLLTSSGAVYGRQPQDIEQVSEDYAGAADPLVSTSAYGVGKRYVEHLAVLYAQRYGFEVKIARCFAFVGPFLPLDTHFAIGNFIQHVLNNTPIKINGDGTPYRSYLYAADLIIWLWAILCQGQNQRAYNVGSADGINIADLARMIAEFANSPLPISIAKQAIPGTAIERYVPSTMRAQQELNLHQWIDLPTAIHKTIIGSYHESKSSCC
jgi:nucleoside-diphosphate-sugar epimerase